MDIREGLKEILAEDLIDYGFTHENPPPYKDCSEECGVTIEDQIAASNPFCSPMRSGGEKHKKCMDCWEEYIDNLITRILKKESSQGVVEKVDRELPEFPFDAFDGDKVSDAIFAIGVRDRQYNKAGYVVVKEL